MLESRRADGRSSMEVCVIPENRRCPELALTRKAQLAPGVSLLGCLGLGGGLLVWDPADRDARPAAVDGSYSDFCWEEAAPAGCGVRLMAVGAQWDLTLLAAEAQQSTSVSVVRVAEHPADLLLQTIREQDQGVFDLQSLSVLTFATGRCCLLVNCDWLLQLQWQQREAELRTLSCCRIDTAGGGREAAVHRCVCRETLFSLGASGCISVSSLSDGALLARVDLPAYLGSDLGDDDLASVAPSFCLLQVSADLCTAVAVAQSHAAVAIDLGHYFRIYPDHLLCAVPPQPPLRPGDQRDQDSLWSSGCSLGSLGSTFSPDRSWEARLASMYSRVQQATALSSSSSSSSSHPAGASWLSFLPHLESHQAPSLAHSRVPQGGMSVSFSVPQSSAPSLLAVSEYSVQVTFVTPGNQRTTVALWDLEYGSVSYHQAEGEAAPVEHCGGRQHRLLLKRNGVSQVLFSVSQQDLLNRLMLFGNTATVDAVCHLNSWGRCSIPIHALQAGLKNRQLDTVDFYLKSKDNILNPPVDQPAAAAPSLTDSIQELCPALDLLCSAVRDSHSEAQSRQFSEQLLRITLSFIQTQIRLILTRTQHEDLQSCVDVLNGYVTELRSYMKRLSCPAGGNGSIAGSDPEEEVELWEGLQTEELVHQSILTNQIPRAQAILRRRGCPEQRLSALRMEGLRQVYSCLQQRELQTAKTLLTNMGFGVTQQLHSICLYTDDQSLRDFMVEELSGRFPEEEMLSVAFVRQMEELGSLPASRCPANTVSKRALRMVCRSPVSGGEEDLEELLGHQRSEEEAAALWSNLRLDWVRNWNQSCRTAILLSRLQRTELTSCDSAVFWRHLTALHDQHRLRDWINCSKEASSALQWPEITPELVNNNTVCSSYLREDILDMLARRGLFIPDEVSDFERFLWRLSQGGGVMSLSSPVLHYRSPLGLDLHSSFISFCLERGLQYLLYTYLEHYRLTPRNCPLLTNQSMSESQPWFQMLVKIQEISRDLSDPGLVFQASLTSAQVLLPDSQASLSGLLLEGHSLLALGAVMFAPGGIDQVVVQGERSERTVDRQLLKMALAAYPKLRAALFPSGPRGNSPPSDVTLYHLMQSLHPLDPSHLFPWQTANPLKSSETAELPHFSSPHLVNRYAVVENLDFLYYLRHGRPSFAYATFLVQKLSGCNDVPLVLQRGLQQVYRLALQLFNTPSVTSAAVCFCELLGICSLKLRVDVGALNIIMDHNTHASTQDLHTLGVKLAEEEPGVADELIGYLEDAVTDQLTQENINRSSYKAAQVWALPVQFCQLHSLTLSSVYPSHCAQDGQFIHFLVFVQLHNFPPQQVRSLVAHFGPSLQAHLSLAFQDLQIYSPRRNGDSESCRLTSREGHPGMLRQPTELFQVLLQSQEQTLPYRYLLQESLVQRCPTLAVMSSCHQEAELLACLCVWVLASIDDSIAAEATSHLVEAPQHHEWTLHDLSIIWRMLLGRGLVRPLLRGFELFQRDCPLVLVLRMFELCCDDRNFSEAKAKLLDFQRTLITLRNGGPAPSSGLPLQWLESQASVLLLLMLQCCSSQYDLHRLLQLLADVDKLLKSNGPDFRMLSQLSQLLQGSGVSLSPRLLQCTSPSVQQEEFQAAVEALQENGCYSQARQVALLAGLSVHRLLLSQLQQEVNSQKSKSQWKRLETRVCFWRRCHDQLKAEGTDPESASQFFLSQTEPGTGASPSEVMDIQERCLLLYLTAHWLSLLGPVPVGQLEQLEKRLWAGRIQQHVLTVAMEKESVFNLPPPTITPEMNTYEAFVTELSNISVLNTDECLSAERVPAPSEEQQELSPEETAVLTALIGRLLDDGSIHEASRACRYFSLHHPDMWIVLRCRGLASGDLKPEPPEDAPETEPRRTMAHSASASSLMSYTALPTPDDEVAVQLQKLVDQCRHGNKYCKQILSLYQLSKELQCSFGQIATEGPSSVLEKLLRSEVPERFRKAQAFIRAQGLSADSVAELVTSAVVQTLLASNQELQPERQMFRLSEGRDSLVQLIKICEDPNLVGVKLLENLNTVPLRDLDCIVELLIVAHDCFSLTCNMEGIVRVLQVARHLSHAYLAPGEHFSLLVRLLTGIRRYNEMTYVVDLLHQNHRFEILLRKKVYMERGQSSSLKTALLDYIKRCLPADSEKHNMVALCFSMRREIGENHEMAARTQLKMIESQAWVVTPDLKSSLARTLSLLKDAAESFSKDSCVRQASRCVRMAKLLALQLHFLNQGSDLRVVNLRPAELLAAVTSLPRLYQVFVVSEAYNYSPDWAEILYRKVILNGDFVYLEELKRVRPLPSSLFEDIFKKLDGAPSSNASNAKRLLMYCDDAYSCYRLAYQNGLCDVTSTLLQDARTSSYLNDRLSR
ncbi:spatacsin [Brachionichthys hirsutus]|uniref:spatacsin n=1 Tax=Brachionichthys hirsutus TaxID=412623 RepID=UPI0036053D78